MSPSASSIQALTVAFPNLAATGIPLIIAMFGASKAIYVALALAVGTITISPLTLAILGANKPSPNGEMGAGLAFRAVGRALINPVVLSPIAGIVFAFLGIPLPQAVTDALMLIGQATGGVALFLTGLILSSQRLLLNSNVVSGVLLKNVALPLVVAGLALLLPMSREAARAAILLAALPSGFFGVLFGLTYGIEFPRGRLNSHSQLGREHRHAAPWADPHGGSMMRGLVAMLCSGQADQHPQMFDLVADCPECEPVFLAAAEELGQDPRRFVREHPPADLFVDRAGQILCCTRALAVWAALGAARPTRAVIAGYSVGEMAAWGCAGPGTPGRL